MNLVERYSHPEPEATLLKDGWDGEWLRAKYNTRMPVEQPPIPDAGYINPSPMEAWIETAIPEGARAIDIGCGNAKFLLHLAHSGRICEGIGLDISDKMIANAQAGAVRLCITNLCFIRWSFEESWRVLPIGAFDNIIMNDVFQCFYSPYRCLGIVCQLLHPQGVFVGMVPYERSGDCDVHLHHFTSDLLTALLKEFFVHVETEEFHYTSSVNVPEGHITWRAYGVR